MATAEERRKILEMLAEGKINTAQAAELLGGTGESAGEGAEQAPDAAETEQPTAERIAAKKEKARGAEEAGKGPGRGPNWLHIRVADLNSGRRKVSVNIPLQLLKAGTQLGRNLMPEFEQIDWDALSSSLAAEEGRALVDIRDEEDGEHVQIYFG